MIMCQTAACALTSDHTTTVCVSRSLTWRSWITTSWSSASRLPKTKSCRKQWLLSKTSIDIENSEINRLIQEFYAELNAGTLVEHDINDNLKQIIPQ